GRRGKPRAMETRGGSPFRLKFRTARQATRYGISPAMNDGPLFGEYGGVNEQAVAPTRLAPEG
ncbi:MAG: hypothetical protein ABI456_21410, partial [Ktedonobacteraceae bacterium]